jgi:hypothetical protein
MKTIRAALIALALASCAPATVDFPVVLTLDPGFTTYEACLIAEATSRWEQATSARFEFSAWAGGGRSPNAVIIRGDPGRHTDTVGYCDAIAGGDIWIDAEKLRERRGSTYAASFTATVMHELGHHMGLKHTSWGVMYGYRVSAPCVRRPDLDAFAELYGGSYIEPTCEYTVTACERL